MSQEAVGTVLTDTDIRYLNLSSHPEDIQPCSMDLRIGKRLWQISAVPSIAEGFNFARFSSFHEVYNTFNIDELDAVLTPGGVYMGELDINTHNLPENMWAVANPKSSSGRIDLHCILIAEGAKEFNLIPAGKHEKVYVIIIPQSFPVKMSSGTALIQARFFDTHRSFLTKRELLTLHESYGIVRGTDTPPVITDDGLMLHLDLSGDPGNLVSVHTGDPLLLKVQVGNLADPTKYFRQKSLYNGSLYLEPGEFLLARAMEKVCIPQLTCAEMLAYSEAQGEIRSHYAGFFDRGFGYGRNGELQGSSVVCEIRNMSQVPIILSHNQPIATLRYEYLKKEPEKVYGEVASNYQGQSGIRLAKYFAPWPSKVPPLSHLGDLSPIQMAEQTIE